MPNPKNRPAAPFRIGLVLFPGCMPAGLFSAADMVRAANARAGQACFHTEWVAVDRRPVPTWQGPSLSPGALLSEARCDAWLVPGVWATSAGELDTFLRDNTDLVEALRRLPRGGQFWSYCVGSALVAAAGRLRGRQAAATWWLQDWLTQRFPKVLWRFDDHLVHDTGAVTAAGPNGHLPLMLDRLTLRLDARAVQDLQQVLMLPRPRLAHPLFGAVDLMSLADPELRKLLVACQHIPAAELSLQRAAEVLNLSVRTLCRRVPAATGLPAGEWLRRVKLRQVGEALVGTRQPLKAIAETLGYGSEASLHRVFRQAAGCTPAQFRLAHSELPAVGR